MKSAFLVLVSLMALGCGAGDQAANEATRATFGSADRAKDVAGQASANVKEGQKTLDESEAR
ncbi:MAG: hypothetical protein WCK51_09360 [Armatimonadota bacterium]